MGIGVSDWPPTPSVSADERRIVSITDWLVPQEKVEPSIVETTQLEMKMRAKLAAQEEASRLAQAIKNTKKVNKALASAKKQINKTRYVFSGSTPRGWDCSGFVRWFYLEHFEIELEHSATAQAFVGEEVEMPKPGDIVVFGYSKKDFFHASIYVGDNKVIHSGFKRGDSTELISLNHPAFDGHEIKFVRLLDTE